MPQYLRCLGVSGGTFVVVTVIAIVDEELSDGSVELYSEFCLLKYPFRDSRPYVRANVFSLG